MRLNTFCIPVRTAEIAAAPAPEVVIDLIAAPNNGPAALDTPPTAVSNKMKDARGRLRDQRRDRASSRLVTEIALLGFV